MHPDYLLAALFQFHVLFGSAVGFVPYDAYGNVIAPCLCSDSTSLLCSFSLALIQVPLLVFRYVARRFFIRRLDSVILLAKIEEDVHALNRPLEYFALLYLSEL